MTVTALQIIDQNFFNDLLFKENPQSEIIKLFEVLFILLQIDYSNQTNFWEFCCNYLEKNKDSLGLNYFESSYFFLFSKIVL